MLAPPKGIGRIGNSSDEFPIRTLKVEGGIRQRWRDSCSNNEARNVGVPLGDGGEKKFNWGSELSTLFRNKHFGQQVEGLSPFRDKTYAIELPVQTHDFEDLAFCGVVRRKPTLAKSFACVERARSKKRPGTTALPCSYITCAESTELESVKSKTVSKLNDRQ